MAPPTCPRCGQPNDSLEFPGPSFFVTPRAPGAIRAVLLSDVPGIACTRCERALPITRTVVYIDPPTILVACGTVAATDCDRLVGELKESAEPTGVPPEISAMSLDDLRVRLMNEVKRSVGHLGPFGIAILKKDIEAIGRLWRSLTPDVFAAGMVATTVPIPGVQLAVMSTNSTSGKLAEAAAAADAITMLAELETQAWAAMYDAWVAQDQVDTTFEEDLATYIDAAVLVPGAAELGIKVLGELRKTASPRSRGTYCAAAMEASLCLAAGRANDGATEWARLYRDLELDIQAEHAEAASAGAALRIGPERAQRTVAYPDLRDAVAEVLAVRREPDDLAALKQLSARAGRPQLVFEVLSESIRFEGTPEQVLDAIVLFLRNAAAKLDGPIAPPSGMLASIFARRDFDALDRLARELTDLAGGDHVAEAQADAWIGKQLKLLRAPERFFARVGEEPREWEADLPGTVRSNLWSERSNLLRILGREDEALTMVDAAIDAGGEDIDDADRRILQRNRAILLRDTGAPDAAAVALRSLLPGSAGLARAELLDSLAIALVGAGRYSEAGELLNEAVAIAERYPGPAGAMIRAHAAANLTALDAFDAALHALRGFTDDESQDPLVTVSVASAWINLLSSTRELPLNVDDDVAVTFDQLERAHERAIGDGDFALAVDCLRLRALMLEVIDNPAALDEWRAVLNAVAQYDVPPSPLELVALAHYLYLRDATQEARTLLAEVPVAMARQIGAIGDVADVVHGSKQLVVGFDRLVETVIAHTDDFSDIRLVAELQRDVLGRARRTRAGMVQPDIVKKLRDGIDSNLTQELRPAAGRMAFLEWCELADATRMLITTMDAEGQMDGHWLDPPEVDLVSLAERLQSRLNGWLPATPGDPFDVAEWSAMVAWLHGALDPLLADDDHLVVIEHPAFVGIPWHVAAAPRWSTSYAAGWLSLLSRPIAYQEPAATRVGLVTVPAEGERSEIKAAIEKSAARTRRLARRSGLPLSTCEGPACDREAFRQLLSSTTWAKIVCHGYVGFEESEVGFAISAEGLLPYPAPLPQHIFSRREVARLERAPSVVFSAACSSGYSHLLGFGERIGLFAGFQEAGTASLVAPMWDIPPASVLPILDDVIERFSTGLPLAKAVLAASNSAVDRAPVWMARSLAVEGGWR